METKALLKFSLIVALIGTFLIVIFAATLKPRTITIESINERNVDEWVKIQGNVTQERTIETIKIFTVNDGTASINCILRNARQKIGNLESLEGKEVEVLGKIIDYKGELEIETNQIMIL
ncbi:MAG: OB-fold nucleic acid binding domain-containing protein [Candidatus Nanoarchaeia archaeon]